MPKNKYARKDASSVAVQTVFEELIACYERDEEPGQSLQAVVRAVIAPIVEKAGRQAEREMAGNRNRRSQNCKKKDE